MRAWPARSRTSSATRASDRSCARSPRSRSGRAARGGGARRRSRAPLRVGDAQVERLDLGGGAEVAGELRVEAGARQVDLVAVGRHLGAVGLQDFPVADGAAADAEL